MSEDIKVMLDQLAEIKNAITVEELHKQDAINAILTQEIKVQLDAISIEFEGRMEAGKENQSALERKIKEAVMFSGQSVKGEYQHAVLTKRRSWDMDALEGYAAAHPEILKFKTESLSVSIRATK